MYNKFIIDQTYNITNSGVFKNILLGIVNIFNGILHFYENGINNCSITDLNILFLLNDPSKMRMLNFKHCEPIEKLNNSDTELKKMYLVRDIYNLLKILDEILQVMQYKDSLKDYKNKYNEYTHPSNNKKYPDLTTKKILDGIRSDILGIINKLGRNKNPP